MGRKAIATSSPARFFETPCAFVFIKRFSEIAKVFIDPRQSEREIAAPEIVAHFLGDLCAEPIEITCAFKVVSRVFKRGVALNDLALGAKIAIFDCNTEAVREGVFGCREVTKRHLTGPEHFLCIGQNHAIGVFMA
jgi:hypothetical protein